MILKVAWRNIWRSRIRSIIVLSSIAIGIWAGLVIIGFSFGMNNERTAAAIGATLGHSQAHHRAFIEDPQPSAVLSEAAIEELETFYTPKLCYRICKAYRFAGHGSLTQEDASNKNHWC